MKYLLLILFLFSITVSIVCRPIMAGENIEILPPPDKASEEGKLNNIVCRINKKSLDTISVMSGYDLARPLADSADKFSISHSNLF